MWIYNFIINKKKKRASLMVSVKCIYVFLINDLFLVLGIQTEQRNKISCRKESH